MRIKINKQPEFFISDIKVENNILIVDGKHLFHIGNPQFSSIFYNFATSLEAINNYKENL